MTMLRDILQYFFTQVHERKRRKLLHVLVTLAKLGRVASFSKLSTAARVPRTSLWRYLRELRELELVEYLSQGVYRLRYLTPFGYLARLKGPYLYIGFLGKRYWHSEPEPLTALRKLSALGYRVEKAIVFTTDEALKSWQNFVLSVEIRKLSLDDLYNEFTLQKQIIEVVEEYAPNYIVIGDCTSGPRIAGIVLYRVLKYLYMTPVIYLREETLDLYWVQ